MDSVSDVFIQNPLEIDDRLDGQDQLLHIECLLRCGAIQGGMDFIEEGRGFEESSQAANGVGWVLVMQVGRPESRLQHIVQGLRS